ncbi:hypothetical protein ACJIZ3_017885 [Penstemon smallii]|uniref:Copper transport protein n=1 Tax=Penstemon smallii TaxID=265156 RepID=A0ABD3SY32_9LAMI
MEHMPGMDGMSPPTNQMHDSSQQHVMSHMTFFWGKNAEILFSGWPGTRTGMYVLALIFVFVLSFLVEWLSNCRWIRSNSGKGSGSVSCGLVRTLLHGTRILVAYVVMLAVMSFNVGVLIVAVAGHVIGFFFFGSGIFKKSGDDFTPPMANC